MIKNCPKKSYINSHRYLVVWLSMAWTSSASFSSRSSTKANTRVESK